MEIYVFDKNLNFIDTIDKFTSLQWIRKYHESGKFELHCPVTDHNIKTLLRDNIIWIQGSDEVGKIEYRNLSVDNQGQENIKINGRFMTSILDRRIMYSTEQRNNKEVELIMRSVVDRNCINTTIERKLPIELGQLKGFQEKINYQKSYGNLLEEISILSETSDIGFFIRTDLENLKHYFETYKGKDRTINQDINSPVVFSREYDNLYEQDYTDSGYDLRTTALVAGEGEGSARQTTEVNDSYSGLDRYELYVDARDIQQTVDDVTMSGTEYINLLKQRGLEKLSEYKDIQTFEGKIISNNYIYKEDYDLGDIVTIMDKKWNVIVNSRITEVSEIYENGKIEIVPTLGDKIPTILDKLKRM
ncbi:siphovirus ReqiPepy6 Gp37-like family protein [Clostridium sp. D2Q-14]|uniref:siphovirus ReqiPepy6 Gp37-like family protein n=1 Tax=Anaeromonas gelatinilytica TaxID=2683194 RepID=UPI00193C2B9C|nr:siphovirus ReqiPepy6 Gp37-like family protein [Anaeromonas gelatinilytica]